MELFDLSPKTNKDKDKELVKQAGKKNSSIVSVKGVKNINQKVATMRDMVERYLGGEKDNYISVTELNVSILDDFVEAVEKSRIVALDTETTGLDTINDDIVGISLFTPGMKALYIPINHISYITNEKTKHQLSVEFLKKWFSWLLAIEDVRYIYFNAKFDYRVILNHIGVKLPISYDAYIASRLLNENEPEKGLKALYKKYVLNGEDDAFSFSQLFEDIPFNLVPIDTAYLYAAKDAQITYELYQFQLPYLTLGTEECTEQELDGVQDVFWNIEMPLIPIVAEMEQLGVKFDFNKQKELSERYHKLQDEAEAAFYEELKKYTPNEYLISSPTQLGTLFYDDLKLLTVQSRGKNAGKKTVDEKTLNQIDHPLVKIVLDYRGYAKLISTYIDKMAECAKYDGRVHGSFNQCGTDTGRMSSDSPNLQNIPAKNAEIRTMFTASDGYVLMSSDYSGQEPRLTACMSGDETMINEYNTGIDPYVTLASIAYNMPYDECKEFRADGTVNKDGKQRRKKAKVLLLAVTYGAGLNTVADGIGVSEQKAQDIMNRVFTHYPKLLEFKQQSENMAYKNGYVTTYWGRKRRLPDFSLPEYEVYKIKEYKYNIPVPDYNAPADEQTVNKYIRELRSTKYKKSVFEKANADGYFIVDNTQKISQAERQCVNSRIQGSAADQTKLAMLIINKNERLKALGFRLLIQVHDELIGECPEENVEECSKLFADCMVEAAKDLPITTKCDVEVMKSWNM